MNHFIIKYKLHGMVTRRRRHWVPWRSTKSLFFNITLYTLMHFWLGTQNSITNLNIFFTWISNLTNCWVKVTMFYKKGEFNLTVSALYYMYQRVEFFIHLHSVTFQLKAVITSNANGLWTYFSSLCHEKQVIWTYIIFLNSFLLCFDIFQNSKGGCNPDWINQR